MDVPNEEVGLGVDIVEIARMRKIIDRSPAFVEKVYSAAERAYCDSHAHPEVHYATRFAAKEAVLKALGTGFSEGIGWLDVEVRRTSKGRPYVVLTGRAAKWPGNRACGRFPSRCPTPIPTPWPAPWPSPRSRGGHRAAARPHGGAHPPVQGRPRPAGRPPGNACSRVE